MAITSVLVVAIFFKIIKGDGTVLKKSVSSPFVLRGYYVKRKLRSSFKGFGKGYQFY